MTGRLDLRAYVAEFIGTFALIFVGVGAIAATGIAKDSPGLVAVALAHGLTIAVMASATAAISGGHLNPAVTLGALVAGKISPVNAVAYWVSQFLGGVAAAALITAVEPAGALAAVHYGAPAAGNGISGTQAMLLEGVLTFFLMFVIYGTAIDRRAPKVGALFIGLTVTLDIFIGGPLTGAAMNPARWFGPAIYNGSLGDAWIYLIGPGAGGALAALLWRFFLEEPKGADTSGAAGLDAPGRGGSPAARRHGGRR